VSDSEAAVAPELGGIGKMLLAIERKFQPALDGHLGDGVGVAKMSLGTVTG